MKKNFILCQGIYIIHQEIWYDLHNNYHFEKLDIFPSRGCVSLAWTKSRGDWVTEDLPDNIKIDFHEVSHFSITNNFVSERITLLHEVGYKEPDDLDLDWLDNEDNFNERNHFVFRFEDDENIRIYAETATFKAFTASKPS